MMLSTALITPFTTSGDVDYEALARLLDTQIGVVDSIIVLGTTGEAATMTEKERTEVREFIVRYVNSRTPLYLGVGGNCTAIVVEQLKALNPTLRQHFAGILSVCPYYNKPTQEGLFQHFSAIADASDVDVMLYNVPGRTGVNMLPETAMRLHHAYPNKITAIKEASGKVDQILSLINMAKGTGMKVLSGDDGIAAELMAAGAQGLVSVASNAFPEDFHRLIHTTDLNEAQSIQDKYAETITLLFRDGNPAGIKSLLSQRGMIENVLRLPLVPTNISFPIP